KLAHERFELGERATQRGRLVGRQLRDERTGVGHLRVELLRHAREEGVAHMRFGLADGHHARASGIGNTSGARASVASRKPKRHSLPPPRHARSATMATCRRPTRTSIEGIPIASEMGVATPSTIMSPTMAKNETVPTMRPRMAALDALFCARSTSALLA